MLSGQNVRSTWGANRVYAEAILEYHPAICDTVEMRGLVNTTPVTTHRM